MLQQKACPCEGPWQLQKNIAKPIKNKQNIGKTYENLGFPWFFLFSGVEIGLIYAFSVAAAALLSMSC